MLSLLLAVPSCIYSFWHGVIPTSYFIFILVSLIFYPGLALGAPVRIRTYAHAYAYCAREVKRKLYHLCAIKIKCRSKTEIAAMDLDLAF